MVQATTKSATCWFLIVVLCSCSFCGLVAEWFRPQRTGDFPINESSVALPLFFWSRGLMVLATDKSATECLVNDSSVALM